MDAYTKQGTCWCWGWELEFLPLFCAEVLTTVRLWINLLCLLCLHWPSLLPLLDHRAKCPEAVLWLTVTTSHCQLHNSPCGLVKPWKPSLRASTASIHQSALGGLFSSTKYLDWISSSDICLLSLIEHSSDSREREKEGAGHTQLCLSLFLSKDPHRELKRNLGPYNPTYPVITMPPLTTATRTWQMSLKT